MERILSAYEFTLEVAARGVHAKRPIKVGRPPGALC